MQREGTKKGYEDDESSRTPLLGEKAEGLQRRLIDACEYFKAGFQEDRARFFSAVPGDKRKGSEQKHEHGKFHLNMQRKFFVLKMVEHCNKLSRELLQSPSLPIILCNLL